MMSTAAIKAVSPVAAPIRPGIPAPSPSAPSPWLTALRVMLTAAAIVLVSCLGVALSLS
jgi:hypothetical protein